MCTSFLAALSLLIRFVFTPSESSGCNQPGDVFNSDSVSHCSVNEDIHHHQAVIGGLQTKPSTFILSTRDSGIIAFLIKTCQINVNRSLQAYL